jgi:PilZ domain
MNIRAKIFGGGDAAEEPLLAVKSAKAAKPDQLDSVRIRRESRNRQNSRTEDRYRLVGERARVTHNGVDYDVELINLSGGGAMISGSLEPVLWDRLNLHLGNHGTIECAVCWLRDGRIGLEFAHETRLDWPSDQVATVLRHVIERTFPHIAFPEVDEPPAPQPQSPQATAEEYEPVNEHRSAPRHPLIWNGTLYHDFQTDAVRVRNISESGAMIEVRGQVRVGGEPLLELSPAVSLSATVEWAVGDQVGLRFHTPFDMNLLAESRPTVAATDWTPPSYLDVELDADDGEDDHWGRLSLYQLRHELEGFLKH